ncbi:MAG: glycosyltransferase family 2 protein [Candidatus Pacebacteria bacterium]|nr:glycosyltransferase family 2 protein [Candidatus Paceibacterota bacterium]
MITVIIPCRNEEKFIGDCLESLIKQDYPKEDLEILVIDGASEDKSREIAQGFSEKYPFIKVLDNPQKFTPFALNIGIRAAKGDVIVRMDSHAGYNKDYISQCVKRIKESGADNVGGVIETLPSKNTLTARAIASALSSSFGAASSFRIGSDKPKEVDTVFGGCFKKEVFQKVGLFDERMLRSQDIEFNKRLKKAGGKILLFPDIVARYYPQDTLRKFWDHNVKDGFWTIYPLKFGVRFFSLRHLLPLFLILGLATTLILGIFSSFFFALFKFTALIYIFSNLFFSSKISLKEDFKLFFVLPLAFIARHFGYGLGSLKAFFKII